MEIVIIIDLLCEIDGNLSMLTKEMKAAIICANIILGNDWIYKCECREDLVCINCKIRNKFDIKIKE